MRETEGRFAIVWIGKNITPLCPLDDALVNMHRASRHSRQRLGHAYRDQPTLERDFMQHMLEQKGLIGDQQRITVDKVDLELGDAHFMHKGIAGDT